MVRAIPGDIIKTSDGKLMTSYFMEGEKGAVEEPFDMVILSVGIGPNRDTKTLMDMIGARMDDDGFVQTGEQSAATSVPGFFAAGTVAGPKSISDTLSHAGNVAGEVLKYLET